jgi:hypothetical protein
MKSQNAQTVGIKRLCTECRKPFYTKHAREISCSMACKIERKKGKIRAANRLRKPNKVYFRIPCIECGTHFRPRSAVHATCSGKCREDRNRRRSCETQGQLRRLKFNAETAAAMVKNSLGSMLLAESLEELDYAFDACTQQHAASLKKLKATLTKKMPVQERETAADAVREAMDNTYVAVLNEQQKQSLGCI